MAELPMIAPGYEEQAPAEELEGVLTNTCVIDKSVLTEAMEAAMRTPFLRSLRVLGPCLMVLCLGLLIWSLATGQGAGPSLWWGFLLGMVSFFYVQQFLLYPRRAVKDQLLRQIRDDGTDRLVNRLYFTEENVGNRRGDSDLVLHMDYDKIKRLTQTRRLLVITTRRNRLIPLDKNGFTNGSRAELEALLRRKVPKLKVL